jgi:hypothetical protein
VRLLKRFSSTTKLASNFATSALKLGSMIPCNFNFFHYLKNLVLFKDKITTNLIKKHLLFFYKEAFR